MTDREGAVRIGEGAARPTLSVALCTYNGAQYLPEQLASISAQSRPPDEIVVCDDRSSDTTIAIVEAFSAAVPFPVRLYVNESTLGSSSNFAKAIALCTGDIIALADQDDIWLPEKLARTERILRARPNVGLVFTDAEVVDEQLCPLGYRLWESVAFDRSRQEWILRDRAFELLFESYVVTGTTMAFRAHYRDLVLPIPKGTIWIHDGWIALMIAAVAEIAIIPEPLVLYRQHENQQIGATTPAPANENLQAAIQISRGVGRNAYLDDACGIEPVCQRLAENISRYGGAASLAHATGKVTHLRARGSMPPGKGRRILGVLRELSTLRYHRYGRGVYSAAKDLWVE
jgi:glycosyltransferase involved in cell wall biosynthesis